jgi:hypothetical protein
VVLATRVLLLPCVQDQSGEIESGVNRGSSSGSRTREQGGDRDPEDTCVSTRGSSGSRRPQGAIGNGGGDCNASRMSLRLTVGLHSNVTPGVALIISRLMQGGLDKATICRVHSCLMNSCQYSDLYYVPAGKTRTETRKTVNVVGAYKVECCPFSDVDGELEYVCKMAKVKMFVVRRFFYFIYFASSLGFYFFVAVDQVVAESLCNSELDTLGIR